MVKIMELKKYKDNNYKRKSYVLLVIGFLLLSISSYLFYKSYALYEEKKDFDVINGTVEDPGDIYFAYYIDGVISRNMPLQNTGYTLDAVKSNCNNGVVPTWDNAGWKFIGDYHNYSATTNTRTKCTLYFNKTTKTVKTALGNIEVNSYTPNFTKSACDDSSCESHEKGIFETTDYDGNPTYYYRGSVENNYVKFAGYYWRIIRINSNGSMKMIYDGTSAHANGENSDDRYYKNTPYNSGGENNMYVGYMYTSGENHGLSVSSTIKMSNENFYKEKLLNYSSKIDEKVGFCGDRSSYNIHKNVGINTTITYYKSNTRFNRSTPSLSCENECDYYTSGNAVNGNKRLTYSIGLISLDEAVFAGYASSYYDRLFSAPINVNGYLSTRSGYWTMSPSSFSYLFNFSDYGPLNFTLSQDVGETYTYASQILRPVISMRSDVTITGSGTMTDPYVVN